VHQGLYSWREELPAVFVRMLAYLCGLLLLSITAAHIFQAAPVSGSSAPAGQSAQESAQETPLESQWIAIERPFPAFALAIPEAAEQPSSYAIRRNIAGGGRKDILSLGATQGAAPYLEVEVYRPGREIAGFAAPQDELDRRAKALGPVTAMQTQEPLPSKFGPMTIVAFDLAAATPRHCLGFLRNFADPMLQLSGRFCQGGASPIERSTLACALDRLTLLSAGSEPKVGALFARAELRRDFCGQRDAILASTPKYTLLWKALATRPEPRRIGR
jgi:hypothetical protein